MPDITIEQNTFERLQNHAKPLVDSTDSVINRALDALELQKEDVDVGIVGEDVKRVYSYNLPDLTHTKILEASVSGKSVINPNWNKVFAELLSCVAPQLNDLSELSKSCAINFVQGRKYNAGYRYLHDIDISVQGMSATNTCEAIVVVAQHFSVDFQITFMWRWKDGAQHPGEKRSFCLPE